MICGLSSDTFDLFITTNDPHEGSDGRTTGRVFGYLRSLIRSDDTEMVWAKGYIKRWWEDPSAEGMSDAAPGSKRSRTFKRWDTLGRLARDSGTDRSSDSQAPPLSKRGGQQT